MTREPGMNVKGVAVALALALAVGLAGCGKKEEGVVKIGHAGPLTGSIAHLGKDNENGVRMAIDEANAAGFQIGANKVKLELLSEDDQADPKQGTIVAQKLVDAKVAGVVGHLNSGTTIPASKIYHDAGIAQISPSATNVTYTNQGFKTAFRVIANDAQQGKVLGEFAVGKLGAKNIAIIDDRSAYGQGLADEFEKAATAAGATILTREFTDTTKTDFTAILTSIKGKNPDLIFYGGMDAQAGPMMKQLKNLGLTAKYLGGDGIQSVEFLKLAADAAEGAYGSSPGVPLDQMPGGKDFEIQVQGQVQPGHPDLRAVRVRRGQRAAGGDEEGGLRRPGQVPARARQQPVPGRDREHHLRREGRHQGRRHQPVPGQGRQVGVPRDDRRARGFLAPRARPEATIAGERVIRPTRTAPSGAVLFSALPKQRLMDIFLQQVINGLVLGSVYALVALGYTMVYGILGLINFAHGEVVMVGALTSLSVIAGLMGSSLGLPAPLIVLLALAVSMSVCMLLGFTIERVAYRPLRRAPRLAPLITAIGVSILLQTLAMMYWGRHYHTFPEIIRPQRHEVLGAVITDRADRDHRGVCADHGRAAAAGALHAPGAGHARDLGESARSPG